MRNHDLPNTLRSLSEMYEQQAESRLGALPGILSPLLLLLVAVVVGYTIAGLVMPLVMLIRAVGGGPF